MDGWPFFINVNSISSYGAHGMTILYKEGHECIIHFNVKLENNLLSHKSSAKLSKTKRKDTWFVLFGFIAYITLIFFYLHLGHLEVDAFIT